MANSHITARGGSHSAAQCAVCVWGAGAFARTNLQATNAEEGGSKWSIGNILKSAVCAVTVWTDAIFIFIFLINSKQRQKEGFAYCTHLKAGERALQLKPLLCVRVCVKSVICKVWVTVYVLNPVVFTQKQTHEVQLYNGPHWEDTKYHNIQGVSHQLNSLGLPRVFVAPKTIPGFVFCYVKKK